MGKLKIVMLQHVNAIKIRQRFMVNIINTHDNNI